jgi:hypothetical protein
MLTIDEKIGTKFVTADNSYFDRIARLLSLLSRRQQLPEHG